MTSFEPKIYLDTELRPNASLSDPALLMVMALVGACSFIGGVSYLLAGAWPVFGFFGLDAGLIWVAFRVSRRRQQQVTYVRVDSEQVRLWHMQHGRQDKRLDLPTAFVHVALERPVTHNSFLTLRYSGRAWTIGRFLTPEARGIFASELTTAIHAARHGGP